MRPAVRAALAVVLLLSSLGLAGPAAQAASGATLTGTVTVTGGAPLGTAFVALIDPRLEPDPDPRSIDSQEVDARGRFTLRKVPAGTYQLAVEDLRGRWAPRVVPVTVGASGTVQAPVRLDRGRTITGRVVRGDGRPAKGATVYVWDADSAYGWTRETVTDAAGRFTARALTAARHQGSVEPETGGDATWAGQCLGGHHVPSYNWYEKPDEVPVVPGCGEKSRYVDVRTADASAGTETLRHRNAFVTGVVRDLAGRGVPRVPLEVRNFYQSDNDFDAGPWQRTTTDAQGRYRVMVDEDDSQRLSISRYRSDGGLIAEASVPMPTPGLGRTAARDVLLRVGSSVRAKARSSARGRVSVRVRVTPRLGTGAPTGRVVVRYTKRNGRAATTTGTLDRTGLVRVKLTKARSGRRTVTVHYEGSARSEAAKARVRVRVR